MTVFRLAVITVFAVILGGCDPTVDPVRDNGLDYSFFGYLDVSADTQYVRIERLRDGRPRSAPRDLDVEVRLTNLRSGRTIALRDSLFHFFPRGTAHNFYTTTDVAPRTSYRLVATGPNDTRSEAETTLPAEPTTTVTNPLRSCFPNCEDPSFSPSEGVVTVRVDGIERLVAAKAFYYLVDPVETYVFDHLDDTTQVSDTTFDVDVYYGPDLDKIPREIDVKRIDVMVAAGGPEWPDFTGLSLTEEQLPGIVSNVEDGVGLLGGVATDTVTVFQ